MAGSARAIERGHDGGSPALTGFARARSAPVRGRRDPLSFILGPSERWGLISICFAIALWLHVTMLIFALVTGLLHDLKAAIHEDRARLHDYFWREYNVEVEKPKDEPKPEPPPPDPVPPEPVAAPKSAPRVEEDPYKNAAPIPAQAAKVLTADSKKDDPVELPTIVSGDGNALGGVQSTDGKGDRITMSRSATHEGVPGGRGTVAAVPVGPPAEDKSRPIKLAGGSSWNCPFPPEADADQIDQAVVTVQLTVRADGSVSSAAVISDPGHGFGRAARLCALSKRLEPALDRAGTPIGASSPVNIRFSR
jgi:periplasmic protein TonB